MVASEQIAVCRFWAETGRELSLFLSSLAVVTLLSPGARWQSCKVEGGSSIYVQL